MADAAPREVEDFHVTRPFRYWRCTASSFRGRTVVVQNVRYSLGTALICGVCAAPSLVWAIAANFNIQAQVVGVAMFMIASACAVQTQSFRRTWEKRRFRVAIQIGYGVRLGLS